MGYPLRQSTATTIPIGRLVDGTDFKTPKTTVTYDQAGVDCAIMKNNGTWDAVTITDTAGDNDWTNKGDGFYTLELTATQTGTLGPLTVSYGATGVYPWQDIFVVIPAVVYDALYAGTDYMQTDVTQWKGATAPDNTGDAYAAVGALPTPLNATTLRAALGMASADLDTQLGTLSTFDVTQDGVLLDGDSAAQLAALVETYLVNEADATATMQAFADKLASDLLAGDISALAIATAVRNELATELARIDVVLSTRQPSGAVNLNADQAVNVTKINGTAVSSPNDLKATGFATPNDVTGARDAIIEAMPGDPPSIDDLPTNEELAAVAAAIVAHGDEEWVTGGAGSAPTVEQIDEQLSGVHGAGAWGAEVAGDTLIDETTRIDEDGYIVAAPAGTALGVTDPGGCTMMLFLAEDTTFASPKRKTTSAADGTWELHAPDGEWVLRVTKDDYYDAADGDSAITTTIVIE